MKKKLLSLVLACELVLGMPFSQASDVLASNKKTTQTTETSETKTSTQEKTNTTESPDVSSKEKTETPTDADGKPISEEPTIDTTTLNENSITIAEWPEAPGIHAGSAILMDADTGTILYDKNSHQMGYPASITKLMTGLLTVENCSLSEQITFSYDAAHSVTWEDAQMPIEEGETYTIEEALYALLLHSANDVAYGLGEHVGGDIATFATMMNNRAAELGATDTHFANASGLSDPDHYTTCYDIAMISKAIMANSTMINIMKTTQYEISASNKYAKTRIVNQRHEMLKPSSEYYYEYAVGGKTGFTDESQYTLCTYATKGDMNLICVVFLCEKPEYRYMDTINLFNYGFDNFEKLTLTSTDTSSLLKGTDYYASTVFNHGGSLNFSLASSAVTVPKGVNADQISMHITKASRDDDAYAYIDFSYAGVNVGNSEMYVTATKQVSSLTKPTNLPYLPETEEEPLEIKEFIIVNVYQIIYAALFTLFLLIMVSGVLFMKFSAYGKEVTKTRRRRNAYKKNRKRFR